MNRRKITKAICVVLAIINLLGSTTMLVSAAPQPRYGDPMYVVAEGGVNVRKNPGLSSQIVGALSYGTQVNVASAFCPVKDGYTWVLISSPKEGYVALEYLSYTRPRSIVADVTKPRMG